MTKNLMIRSSVEDGNILPKCLEVKIFIDYKDVMNDSIVYEF